MNPKHIEIEGRSYTVGPVTLAQVIALQSASAVLQRLTGAPQQLHAFSADELRTLATGLASILGTEPAAVLGWPLAQTLSAAVLTGQAFLEVNGPYLQQHVVPAIERLTAFATTLASALQPRAPAPQ